MISQGCIVYKDNIIIIGEKSSSADELVFTKNNNLNSTNTKEEKQKSKKEKKYDDYWESEF